MQSSLIDIFALATDTRIQRTFVFVITEGRVLMRIKNCFVQLEDAYAERVRCDVKAHYGLAPAHHKQKPQAEGAI